MHFIAGRLFALWRGDFSSNLHDLKLSMGDLKLALQVLSSL